MILMNFGVMEALTEQMLFSIEDISALDVMCSVILRVSSYTDK